MTQPAELTVTETDLDALAGAGGRIVVFVVPDGKLDAGGRRINKLTRGALARFAESDAFGKMKAGETRDLAYPAGVAAEAVQVVKLPKRPAADEARKAGVAIGRAAWGKEVLILGGALKGIEEVALGALLRAYRFTDHKSAGDDTPGDPTRLTLMVSKPDEVSADRIAALAEGVFFTRDLVNAPSNVLTTTEFADRLSALSDLGLKVEVLDEADLDKLGMRTLLAVGQGSESPSKVVVMEWQGGKKGDAPLALVGKGVVFDTGGISLKPAAGMEDMTMDMGGAGVVAGVMKALALRKAKANVVGLVGLVENMPDGRAQRPGDVVTSM